LSFWPKNTSGWALQLSVRNAQNITRIQWKVVKCLKLWCFFI
jgi:hypothetical protein